MFAPQAKTGWVDSDEELSFTECKPKVNAKAVVFKIKPRFIEQNHRKPLLNKAFRDEEDYFGSK